jgi:hypothetical protein
MEGIVLMDKTILDVLRALGYGLIIALSHKLGCGLIYTDWRMLSIRC